ERADALRAQVAAVLGSDYPRRFERRGLPGERRLRWVHPAVGELRLDREVLDLPDDAQQLVVLAPVDEASAVALDLLRGAGRLRAIG
ncbi:MAG: transcriptional regulator, partial [Nocardioides sp.]